MDTTNGEWGCAILLNKYLHTVNETKKKKWYINPTQNIQSFIWNSLGDNIAGKGFLHLQSYDNKPKKGPVVHTYSFEPPT